MCEFRPDGLDVNHFFSIYFTLRKICQMSSLKRDQSYIYIPKHSWISTI